MESSRRSILKLGAAALAAAAAAPLTRAADKDIDAEPGSTPMSTPSSERRGDMLYRELGKTGEKVSLIGLGGFHIGIPKDDNESIKLVRTAIDKGITFMDNCWDYH